MFIIQVISGWFVAHVGEIGIGWIHRSRSDLLVKSHEVSSAENV